MRNRSLKLSLGLFICLTVLPSPCRAEFDAVGFGWNAAKHREEIYSIDLTSGTVAQSGIVPNLVHLALGSFTYDPQTRSVAILGANGSGKLYLVDTVKSTTLTFALPAISGVVFQDTIFNPKDGNLYVFAYDGSAQVNKIYRVTLIPGTASGGSASAQLDYIASVAVSFYRAGSTNIDSDGVFSLIDSSDVLHTLDLSSLASSQTQLDTPLQSDAVCPDTSLIGIGYDGENFFSTIEADGSTAEFASTPDILGWSLGSQLCTPASVLLVATDKQNSRAIFTVSRDTGDVNETVLSSSNIDVVYPHDISAAAAPLAQASRSRRVKAPKYKVISASTIGRCGKRYPFIRNAQSMSALVTAARRVKFNGSKCKASN